MLTVYTYPIPKPKDCFDLSGLPLDKLCESASSIHEHQKKATIWFGYLDGWMLTPLEAVVLRKLLRTFDCIVVSHHPMSFSHSWKNEIDWIYTEPLNGDSCINNHDSSV
jgi:hypothetical protein